jgi:hypothetical protein
MCTRQNHCFTKMYFFEFKKGQLTLLSERQNSLQIRHGTLNQKTNHLNQFLVTDFPFLSIFSSIGPAVP